MAKFDRRRLKAKREAALVLVTGNILQTSIDLRKKLLVILLVQQKGFNRIGPNELVDIEESVCIVSKFIEIKLFRIV